MKHRQPAFEQVGNSRSAVDENASRDIAADTSLPSHFRAFRNRDMPSHRGLTAQHHEILKRSASGNRDLSTEQAMLADHHIVADLNQIIDFGAFPNDGSAKTRPVYRSIGAQFNVVADHHHSDLRNFFMAAFDKVVTKTVGADHHARLNTDPITDDALRGHDDAGHQPTVVPNPGFPADKDLSLKMSPRAHHRAGFNHAQGPHGRRFRDSRPHADNRTRMDSGRGSRPKGLFDAGADFGQCHRRIVDQEEQLIVGWLPEVVERQKYHGCSGRPHRALVLWVAQKRKVSGTSLLKSREAPDRFRRKTTGGGRLSDRGKIGDGKRNLHGQKA